MKQKDHGSFVFLLLDIAYLILILTLSLVLVLSLRGRKFGAEQTEALRTIRSGDSDLTLYLDGAEVETVPELDQMFDTWSYDEDEHELHFSRKTSVLQDMMRTAYKGVFDQKEQ